MHGSFAGPARRTRRIGCPVIVTGALIAQLGGCLATGQPHDGGAGPSPSRPRSAAAAAAPFWVNPDSAPALQVDAWRRQGREKDAELLERIARQPVAEWIGSDGPERQARGLTEAAHAAGRTAVLVLYNIPHRDCGRYSRGGAFDGDAYRAWLDRVVTGIGERSTVVILEPDALPHVADGCTPARYHQERYALLKYAIGRLASLPRTTVYLDAGNAGWVRDPRRMAEPLERAGIAKADGFALNISNFYTTSANTAYGKELSRLLGGKHFVIDTSRNGRGPLAGAHAEAWCNPPGRGLGTPPTTATGDELADAFLWVKHPGDSDGTCKGGPKAGAWWPDYALGLARNAVPGG
jgi:endoglucanase